jgi:hypothetical protein
LKALTIDIHVLEAWPFICHGFLQILKKFDLEKAKEALQWVEDVLGEPLDPSAQSITDHNDVKACLMDGKALCRSVRLPHEIKASSRPKNNRQSDEHFEARGNKENQFKYTGVQRGEERIFLVYRPTNP